MNKMCRILLLVLLLHGCGEAVSAAAPSPQEAADRIDRVLEDERFGHQETISVWQHKEVEKPEKSELDWLERLLQWLSDLVSDWNMESLIMHGALFLRVVFWLALGGLLVYLLLRFTNLSTWLQGLVPERTQRERSPEVLFGLDLRPESLPKDLVAECHALLGQGQVREAMSLLYRGTLSRLLNERSLALQASLTEMECVRLVSTAVAEQEASFFHRLTLGWMAIAYAHRQEPPSVYQGLVDEWQGLYGAP
jgi:hypothetical protein